MWGERGWGGLVRKSYSCGFKNDTVTVFHQFVFAKKFSLEVQNIWQILHLETGYGIKHDTVTVFHWVVFANKFIMEAQNPRRVTRVSRVLFQVWGRLSLSSRGGPAYTFPFSSFSVYFTLFGRFLLGTTICHNPGNTFFCGVAGSSKIVKFYYSTIAPPPLLPTPSIAPSLTGKDNLKETISYSFWVSRYWPHMWIGLDVNAILAEKESQLVFLWHTCLLGKV